MANRHPTSQQKSRQAHVVAGTERKDRHTDLRSPLPTTGAPEPPEPIEDPMAQREWDRLIWAFNDMGYLAQIDAHVVYQHCHLFAEVERIAAKAREVEAGIAILNENLGHVEKKDLIALFQEIVKLHQLLSKYTDQLRNGRNAIRLFLVEHGLTPSSRGRIKLPPLTEPAVDEFSAMQSRRAAS